MMGLQVRLTLDTRLGDLAKDIINGFEMVLRYNRQPMAWGHRQKTKLIRIVRNRLAKAVRAYAACGRRARCHDVNLGTQKLSRILLLRTSVPTLTLQLESAV